MDVSELPIFKAGYDLVFHTFLTIKKFPKEYKYTLGERIKNEGLDLLTTLYQIPFQREKKSFFEKSKSHLQTIRLLYRLSYDLRVINLQKLTQMNVILEDIIKQITGWEKSHLKNT
jgi:hypothetical protein